MPYLKLRKDKKAINLKSTNGKDGMGTVKNCCSGNCCNCGNNTVNCCSGGSCNGSCCLSANEGKNVSAKATSVKMDGL